MTLSILPAFGVLSLTSVVKCVQYGHNYVPVRRDNEAIAANFQDIEGFELMAPAFTSAQDVPPGFASGREGPTDDAKLGI